MRATCPSCQTTFKIDDKRIPPGGARLKCSTCQTLFPVRPEAAAPSSTGFDEAIPLLGENGAAAAVATIARSVRGR
jgi:predicted Zn finger-like uncharacterized protein